MLRYVLLCDQSEITLIQHNTVTNAAFTCYRYYRKCEFPNRKLDMNGLPSRIYNWETQDNFDTQVSKLGKQ